ncbi:hypothetical protein H6P81_018427 [Aristolochia fimbriata]|uniref:TauD/TfdA-like domain-containing protein n=1 Tax=Aristolochia fimbriata TaxID=158543 RepID=A0AAV7E1U8_ARIFI|nr:hypothetical protein H6P81_018427 [Aristolochia fimbriata]
MTTTAPFRDSSIRTEKVFGGATLPKTLAPSDPAESGADALAAGVRGQGVALASLLRDHGAILFRGFDVTGPAEFRRVVEAFGWDDMPYLGGAPRVKVDERVFTANEAPLDHYIKFHHEMAMMKEMPSKLFFFCLTPPGEGGATSVARSEAVVAEMERRAPEFVRRLSETGLVLDVEYPLETSKDSVFGSSWKTVLGIDDPVLAEQRAFETMRCSTFEMTEEGTAKIRYGPFPVIETVQGRRIWLNNIDGPEMKMGDEAPVPQEAVEAYRNAFADVSVDVDWQKGDVLLVDNLSTQHARRPGKPPRKVLVSMCK